MHTHSDITRPQINMDLLFAADQIGVRLEIMGGMPVWEAHPGFRHQKTVDEIRATLAPTSETACGSKADCPCFHYADIYIRFPDGSLKRPDISVFCQEPPETDDAVTMLPEAVIEVVSAGYEAKDLELGPLFYLAQGVKEVIVFDPRTLLVLHVRSSGTRHLTSPMEIDMLCGCSCTV